MNRQMTIDMPDEMHAEFERHATAAGMSLEAYLVDVLITRISREESLRQGNAARLRKHNSAKDHHECATARKSIDNP